MKSISAKNNIMMQSQDISAQKYTLQQFATIFTEGFNYVIPAETLALISKLSMEVGSPTYVKTPVFQKKQHTESRKKQPVLTEEDWTAIRSFQATKIEKKEGIDGLINKIQLQLNKISEKTKAEATNNIIVLLDELVETGANQEDMCKVGGAFFAVASSNRFFSKLYADLYTVLIAKHAVLREVFQISFNSFNGLFQKIECGDADRDYLEFCDFIKVNETRRALCLFFVNLSKNGVLDKVLLLQTLSALMRQTHELMQVPNKQNDVNELCEIIGILYSDELVSSSTEEHHVCGMSVKQLIVSIARSMPKTFPSLSNKAKFKFMDIADAMKRV
jgi:hypothetical protein